jgi:hypothetical protein
LEPLTLNSKLDKNEQFDREMTINEDSNERSIAIRSACKHRCKFQAIAKLKIGLALTSKLSPIDTCNFARLLASLPKATADIQW